MASYFVDTSAHVKRYVTEIGSRWLTGFVQSSSGSVIFIAELTTVEMLSAFARRQRDKRITFADAASRRASFLLDVDREYLVVPFSDAVVARARDLVIKHPLRALDAIQLACALEAVAQFNEPMTFISADRNLLMVATLEGLGVDDPNLHP